MGQVFILVGEQPQDFLHSHIEALPQQQNQKLQRRFTFGWVLFRVYLFDIESCRLDCAAGLCLTDTFLDLHCSHAPLVPILITVKELFEYLWDEGMFSLKDEVLNTLVELHP